MVGIWILWFFHFHILMPFWVCFFFFFHLQKYVFPQYPDLGNRLFSRMHKTAKAKTKYLGVTAFRQQCELYLSVLDDALIHEHYVKMFIVTGNSTEAQQPSQPQMSDEDLLLINTNGLTELLLTCFRIGVANYIAFGGKADAGSITLPVETYCPYVNICCCCFFCTA